MDNCPSDGSVSLALAMATFANIKNKSFENKAFEWKSMTSPTSENLRQIISYFLHENTFWARHGNAFHRGQKLKTNLFFSNFFGHTRDIPAKIPAYPAKQFGFRGFRRTCRTFWPPPLHVEDPHSSRRYPDQKVWLGVPFSSLISAHTTTTTDRSYSRGALACVSLYPKVSNGVMWLLPEVSTVPRRARQSCGFPILKGPCTFHCHAQRHRRSCQWVLGGCFVRGQISIIGVGARTRCND